MELDSACYMAVVHCWTRQTYVIWRTMGDASLNILWRSNCRKSLSVSASSENNAIKQYRVCINPPDLKPARQLSTCNQCSGQVLGTSDILAKDDTVTTCEVNTNQEEHVHGILWRIHKLTWEIPLGQYHYYLWSDTLIILIYQALVHCW